MWLRATIGVAFGTNTALERTGRVLTIMKLMLFQLIHYTLAFTNVN